MLCGAEPAQPSDAPLGAVERAAAAAGEAEREKRRLKNLRVIVLVLLIVQNSVITLITRSTRNARPAGAPMYLGAAAVFASELVKLPVCLGLVARDMGGVRKGLREVWERVFVDWRDTLKLSIPALAYCLQNALFFVALSNLSAASYQLWSQSKTLTTALFFVFYLGGTLRPRQWAALAMLAAGVGLVQLTDVASGSAALMGNPTIGIAAVLASSLLSGFSNVYLEKIIKTTDVSLWIRNVQLGLFSIPQAALLLLPEMGVVRSLGLWAGFTPAVWLIVVLKAFGGLVVAAVVKYADNILKTFGTSVAIALTCAAPRPAALRAPGPIRDAAQVRHLDAPLRHGAHRRIPAGHRARDRLSLPLQLGIGPFHPQAADAPAHGPDRRRRRVMPMSQACAQCNPSHT